MPQTSQTVTTALVSLAEVQSARDRAAPAGDGSSIHVIFKNMTDSEYLQTEAIHEAAHAVVALAIGLPLESVTVAPGQRLSVGFDGPPIGPARINEGSFTTVGPHAVPELYDDLTLFAAGEVAVRHWLRTIGQLDDDSGADAVYQALSDREAVLSRVTKHGLSITAGHLAAERFIVEHWREINRLAYWLRIKGTVTGAEARALTGINLQGGGQ